jgi:16S rRNA (uracil1498-N3)-methyltransferase
MELFYGTPSGHLIFPAEDELNHLINVKRLRTGDEVQFTDGLGNIYRTRIMDAGKKNCSFEILSSEHREKKKFRLHIAIAPTKSIDRIEWFIEKAVEMGIDEITFLNCRHSERKEVKTDRLVRVAVAAMKQSLKTYLPVINPMTDFDKFSRKEYSAKRLLFSISAPAENNLHRLISKEDSIIALIGPEGDFHPDEIKNAMDAGYIIATLGDTRLRTETAAVSVCAIFNFINAQ